MPTPDPTAAPGARRRFLLVWLAVAAVAVLSHFAFAHRLGMYEDDFVMVGLPMCEWRTVGDLWNGVYGALTSFVHGRPLHFVICNVLTFVSSSVGGLFAIFATVAAVWVLNAGLCLALLWRRFGPPAATAAALVFVLFPADTTHPHPHVALCVQPAVTFLLLSGLAYARGWPIVSAAVAALSLFTYETCFFPALVWPFLFADTRPLWRRCLTHWVALAAVLALAAGLRVQLGEQRTADALTDKAAIVAKVQKLAVVGPETSAKTFASRPVLTVRLWRSGAAFLRHGPSRRTTTAVALAAGLAALGALLLAGRRSAPVSIPAAPDAPAAPSPAPPVETTWPIPRLIGAGALMVVVSYPVSLTREPDAIFGRMSSVHIGAMLGWAVLCAGLFEAGRLALRRVRCEWAFAPVLATYLCLLAGFHVYVQREAVRAWAAQGEFWRDVAAECPDVGPGTVILYPLVPPTGPIVAHQGWADPFVFSQLFVVPPDWKVPPRAYPYGRHVWGAVPKDPNDHDWSREIEVRDGKVYWKHWVGAEQLLEPGNVIVLRERADGRFERVFGTVRMGGVDVPLKPREGAPFGFEPNDLYPAMFPMGLRRENRPAPPARAELPR